MNVVANFVRARPGAYEVCSSASVSIRKLRPRFRLELAKRNSCRPAPIEGAQYMAVAAAVASAAGCARTEKVLQFGFRRPALVCHGSTGLRVPR